MRGGRVKLQSIIMPNLEFGNTEKGDALYAMELALSLEKLNNEKLLALHKVRRENNQRASYIVLAFAELNCDVVCGGGV
jgi:ferritin heavy chain